ELETVPIRCSKCLKLSEVLNVSEDVLDLLICNALATLPKNPIIVLPFVSIWSVRIDPLLDDVKGGQCCMLFVRIQTRAPHLRETSCREMLGLENREALSNATVSLEDRREESILKSR